MNPMAWVKIITLGVKLRNLVARGAKISKAHRKGRLVGEKYNAAKALYQKDAAALGYDPNDKAGSLKRAFMTNVAAFAGDALSDDKTKAIIENVGDALFATMNGDVDTAGAIRKISAACAVSENEFAQNAGSIADLTCEVIDMQRSELDDLLDEAAELDPSVKQLMASDERAIEAESVEEARRYRQDPAATAAQGQLPETEQDQGTPKTGNSKKKNTKEA